MDILDLSAHLEPKRWAPYVAEVFAANIGCCIDREVTPVSVGREPVYKHAEPGTFIKRTVLVSPAHYGEHMDVDGVPVYFDNAYQAFSIDELGPDKTFDDAKDYLIPAAQTFSRYVDYLTPYSDEIILRPIDTPAVTPEAGERVWQDTAFHNMESVVTCGIYRRDGLYYVCLELAIGAKLKKPPRDHAEYLERTERYLGITYDI